MKKKLLMTLCSVAVATATLFAVLFIVRGGEEEPKIEEKRFVTYLYNYFDTVTTITGYAKDGDEFNDIVYEISELLCEYHELFDIYNRYAGVENLYTVNKLYDGAHKTVKVDEKIIDMLLYAKKMYEMTDGRMNIAMGSVLSIWHDYRTEGIDNPAKAKLPSMDELLAASAHTDINDVIIDKENSTVYLADPKMTLDVGAIAKGYAVEMIAQHLEKKGIDNFVINVGGNIRTIGKRGDGKFWSTGVENPYDTSDGDYIAYLGLGGESIVTSGSYQRFYFVNGKTYHHIIDGDTLMPAEYFVAVSVICKNSADGDGLSTALFCISLEEGQALVESLDGVEAMWSLPDGTRVKSSGFSVYEEQYQK